MFKTINLTILLMVISMKKFIVFLCMMFLIPLPVLAYSSEVVLGGSTIGIDIQSDGVMIIGFYQIDGKYHKSDLVEGDVIIEVEGEKIETVEDLSSALEKNIDKESIQITYLRGEKEKTTQIELLLEDGVYKTGLYVKDGITGIGTLTFIDPATDTYGALGHEVLESNTSKIVEVKTGSIFKNEITSIDVSRDGEPGSKNAKFYYQSVYGDIDKNTRYGIYGTYTDDYDETHLIEIAEPEEVMVGKATIYTVLDGIEVEAFEIDITKINESSEIKNISFEITDPVLLEKTGGVVQGMSGSPIVQNGKLIGAVTHVVTDRVATGYGLFITTMLEESES